MNPIAMASFEEDPFRSARLVYRPVDVTEHESFFREFMSDSIALRNSGGRIKPASKKDAEELMEFLDEKTLLAVIVCLPVVDEPQEGEPPIAEVMRKMRATAAAAGEDKEKEKLIPIGTIHMDAGKILRGRISRKGMIAVDFLGKYRGLGYGTEAIKWITEWGFVMAGLHRIEIGCYSYNEGARKLYERLGFVFEGRKRDFIWMNGGWHDVIEFSMLEDEWKQLREKGLW